MLSKLPFCLTVKYIAFAYICCCCSVPKSCLTLYEPMNCSTPGFPVHYYLLELAQIHVYWVGSAIQPSHPQSSPSPALNPSQWQSLYQWVSLLHQLTKILELQLQSVLPKNIQGWFPLGLTGLISLPPKGLSRVFSNTTLQKHQFFSTQPSLWSKSHIYTWLLKNHSFDYPDLCQQSDVSVLQYAV